jgi:hypothetical protein
VLSAVPCASGYGFKHASVRLADDTLVITKSEFEGTFSVALLSLSWNMKREQTYKAEKGVIDSFAIPIITKDQANGKLREDLVPDETMAAKVIQKYTGFEDFQLTQRLGTLKEHGTILILCNLKKIAADALNGTDSASSAAASSAAASAARAAASPQYELDWKSTSDDIRIKLDGAHYMRTRPYQQSTEVPSDYSLRAYTAMMFLDGTPRIVVRGTAVAAVAWEKFLANVRKYECPLTKTTFIAGHSKAEQRRGNNGIHLYWHNTLIQTYLRVGKLQSADRALLGVIGVLDVGTAPVQTTNSKQGFKESEPSFSRLIAWLASTVDKYVYDVLKIGVVEVASKSDLDREAKGEGKILITSDWAQCDNVSLPFSAVSLACSSLTLLFFACVGRCAAQCNKWRRIPKDNMPGPKEKWFCNAHAPFIARALPLIPPGAVCLPRICWRVLCRSHESGQAL